MTERGVAFRLVREAGELAAPPAPAAPLAPGRAPRAGRAPQRPPPRRAGAGRGRASRRPRHRGRVRCPVTVAWRRRAAGARPDAPARPPGAADPQLLVAGRIRALRLPLLRRARARPSARCRARAVDRTGARHRAHADCGASGRRARDARPRAARGARLSPPHRPSAEALARICAGRGLRAPGRGRDRGARRGSSRTSVGTELCARLARATQVRREQRFSFALGSTGCSSPARSTSSPASAAGCSSSTTRPTGSASSHPATVVARDYATQRARLRARRAAQPAPLGRGRPRVSRASAGAGAGHVHRRRAPALDGRARGARPRRVRARRFEVTAEPVRAVCAGCPAQGGLCSWPVAMTRRERADQLF